MHHHDGLHGHAHQVMPDGEHKRPRHPHRHEPLVHAHAHAPDVHHSHGTT